VNSRSKLSAWPAISAAAVLLGCAAAGIITAQQVNALNPTHDGVTTSQCGAAFIEEWIEGYSTPSEAVASYIAWAEAEPDKDPVTGGLSDGMRMLPVLLSVANSVGASLTDNPEVTTLSLNAGNERGETIGRVELSQSPDGEWGIDEVHVFDMDADPVSCDQSR